MQGQNVELRNVELKDVEAVRSKNVIVEWQNVENVSECVVSNEFQHLVQLIHNSKII